MKVGDLVMRLVGSGRKGAWESGLIVADDRHRDKTHGELLIVSDAGRSWVDVDDLATMEEYKEMVG
jgi:hypothetical protein